MRSKLRLYSIVKSIKNLGMISLPAGEELQVTEIPGKPSHSQQGRNCIALPAGEVELLLTPGRGGTVRMTNRNIIEIQQTGV